MAEKYILKNSGTETVVKVYSNDSNGSTIDVALSEFAENGETVTHMEFKELFWTCRPNKSVTVHRVDVDDDLEGGYYFSNVGHWHFNNFNDGTYSTMPFRFTFDGPGTVIIRLKKIVA
jgi:hypothetical protein